MNPTSDDPTRSPDSPPPKPGWNLCIHSPEESERMLREEPRIPAKVMLAELYREIGEDPPNE
jgi:hypothetical protein